VVQTDADERIARNKTAIAYREILERSKANLLSANRTDFDQSVELQSNET
jgi:hypothetical protein